MVAVYTELMDTKPLRIVQISDTHLFEDQSRELAGRNTWNSFLAVRDLVLAKHPDPDMILLTGDLSQDFSDESYQHLAGAMESFSCPIYWIPGNHDKSVDLKRVMSSTQCKPDKDIVTDAWHIVLLDSSVEGKVFGEFSEAELHHLSEAVGMYPEKYFMVCLHHHPISVDVSWLDNIGLKHPDRFLGLVNQHPNLRLIAWGHIHLQFEKQEGDVQYLSVPSTCIQFSPDSDNFELDRRLPGYRWFELSDDGSVLTGVNRVNELDDNVDYSIAGY